MAGSIFQNGTFFCGFDGNPSLSLIFTQGVGGGGSSTNTPFGYGLSINPQNIFFAYDGILFGENISTHYNGCAFMVPGLPGSVSYYHTWVDVTAGVTQLALRLNPNGQLQFYLGSGTGTPIGSASSALTIQPNVYVYLETAVTIGASGTGSVKCNVNGANVITATGVTTQSSSNAWVNCFQFGATTANSPFYDDWYMLDGTGSAPYNTFLGPIQVRGDVPTANSVVGGRNAWTPTSPTGVNYSNVANIPASSTKFNADSNPGDYDMFRYNSLPSNVTNVLATNEWATLLLDSAGARTVALNTYSNGTDSIGTSFTPSSTAALYNKVSLVDPHTSSAWTVSGVNAAEHGVKVVS
jgi:hypothetical protein